jgi:hypothetical protein
MSGGTVTAVSHGVGVGISHEVNKFSNSKILLLEPIEGSFTQEHRVLIRRTLFENGSDRLFTESILERGGMRIEFKSSKPKEMGERILRENLKIFKPPKGRGAWLKKAARISGHSPNNLSFDLSSKFSGRCPHPGCEAIEWRKSHPVCRVPANSF